MCSMYGCNTTSKKGIADLKAIKSSENKCDVMRVLGCLGIYRIYIKDLHVERRAF